MTVANIMKHPFRKSGANAARNLILAGLHCPAWALPTPVSPLRLRLMQRSGGPTAMTGSRRGPTPITPRA
jgi:hypothetical protein